ncbi:MAG: hypothetical protein ACREEM_09195 [Blastocatellia bacterium]
MEALDDAVAALSLKLSEEEIAMLEESYSDTSGVRLIEERLSQGDYGSSFNRYYFEGGITTSRATRRAPGRMRGPAKTASNSAPPSTRWAK